MDAELSIIDDNYFTTANTSQLSSQKYHLDAVRCSYPGFFPFSHADAFSSEMSLQKASKVAIYRGRHVLIPSPHIISSKMQMASIPILPIKSSFDFLEYLSSGSTS
ncbi:MAG: hypothetical protein ACQ9MH_26030 [Nitrospinales bacterium]